jgi:sigma-B regulation protein RsbU (phosphoserine phosphatase)
VEIAQLSVASQKVDGDFIDFFKQSETCFDLVVGDVMGKGIPAALLGAAMKSHLLRTINEMLIAAGHNGQPDIGSIISGVHCRMIKQLSALETFVTLCYARFDLESRCMRFVDCGHMPIIHYHDHSRSCTLLKGEDRPLGLPTRNGFESKRQDFLPGDVFVFYSDGLTEAKNVKRTMYGETNLVEQVKQHAGLAPQELLNMLWKDIVCFSESDTFADDVTCVVVKIVG